MVLTAATRVSFARLDSARLSRIQALERQLGVCLVAFEPQYPLANLTPEQLEDIKAEEQELGVVLLAYKCGS